MSDLKVIFVGCNPSPHNTTVEPFVGTKSHKTIREWVATLGLLPAQCGYVNVTDEVTKKASEVKKKDVNVRDFNLGLLLKALEMNIGQPDATKVMMAKMQAAGRLEEAFTPMPKEEMEAHIEKLKSLPMPKVIALGKMAVWALGKIGMPCFELPHPSGLNRKVNDKEALQKTLADCKSWLYSTPEESTKGDENDQADSSKTP